MTADSANKHPPFLLSFSQTMLSRVLDDYKAINESNRSYSSELDRLRVSPWAKICCFVSMTSQADWKSIITMVVAHHNLIVVRYTKVPNVLLGCIIKCNAEFLLWKLATSTYLSESNKVPMVIILFDHFTLLGKTNIYIQWLRRPRCPIWS